MKIKKAKTFAREWVEKKGSTVSGFCGAFFHGSINWISENDNFPKNSDLDLMIVLDSPEVFDKKGKFRYKGILLEVSYISIENLKPPRSVLINPYLAGSFWRPNNIKDPSGYLTKLHEFISKNFTKRKFVVKRCEFVENKILNNYQIKKEKSLPDQVLSWVFPTGITAHLLLAAGFKNLTVRKRYVEVKKLLKNYGQQDFYSELLVILGCAHMNGEDVENHLEKLTEVFAVAREADNDSFPFSSDISSISRPIAIGGSRELIAKGYHREAVFWIVVTYSRCLKILLENASQKMDKKFITGYQKLLSDLGINCYTDLKKREKQLEKLLPQIWKTAESIIESNTKIHID